MDRIKLKYLTNKPLMYGANESAVSEDKDKPRFIRITDINEDGSLKDTTFKSLDLEKAKPYLLKKNDILFARTGATVGKTYIHSNDELSCFAGYLIKFESDINKLLPKLLFYYSKTIEYQDWIRENTIQATIQNVSAEKYKELKLPIFKMNEQNIVISFLDRKLSDLNFLIYSKEKQIKLLEEQRQAMITEAVTKGLNPNVKMKDSGVDWIGEIPEHWNLKKLKYISKIKTSNVNKKSTDGEKSVKLCNYTDVYYNDFVSNSIDFMQATATKEQIEKFTLKRDNVLITKDSENPNDIGIPAYVVEDFIDVVCGYHLTVLEPKKSKMLGKYLYYSIVAKNFQEQFHSKANGVTRYGLTLSSIGDSLILEPTIEEQLKIISKLDSTSSYYKTMKEKIKKQIIKLKEYRQSLIHEAVSGKIPIEEMETYLKEAENDGN